MSTVFRTRFLCLFIGPVITGAALLAPAHAALLVYEGFNGYANGVLEGKTPNANTVGLDSTIGYYDGAATSRAANYTIQAAGLSLGSLQISGGSLQFTATSANVIGADLDIGGTPFTGTLWSSYLVNLTTKGGTTVGDGAVIRIGNTPSDSNPTNHFNSWADSRSSSANVAVGYGSTGTNSTTTGLTTGTTYIIINRFTNVGGAAGGTASLWVLDAAQFTTFLGTDRSETSLGTAAATNTLTGSFIFSSTQAFGIVTVNDAGTYDEIRFGSSLSDVTPTAIPEPGVTAAIFGLVAVALVGFRRLRAIRA